MSYDKNGLGLAEFVQVGLYFPSIMNTIEDLIETNPNEALSICRKTIEAYNKKMLDIELEML